MSETSTTDQVRAQYDELQSALTSATNAEMVLTDDPQENEDAWEELYSAASSVQDAAEGFFEAVEKKYREAVKVNEETEES